MDKYIVVTTLCDKKKIANKIVDTLLSKKLVAGSQVIKVNSKYYWNKNIEEGSEYKLEFRTKESKFIEIESEIKKIINANKEFLSWIDENIK